MQLVSKLMVVGMMATLVSCGSATIGNQKHSLKVKAISMTMDLSQKVRFTEMNPVKGKQCITNKSHVKKNGGNFLYDEVVYQTQKKYKADALVDVTFYDDGGCVALTGTAAKVRKL